MKREIVCIVCPQGCLLCVDEENGDIQVTGNICEKGITFAEKEILDPERTLTTTVKLSAGGLLPVRSSAPVKKHEMKSLVTQLKSVTVTPPVTIGQMIATGLGENTVDIIATDNIG